MLRPGTGGPKRGFSTVVGERPEGARGMAKLILRRLHQWPRLRRVPMRSTSTAPRSPRSAAGRPSEIEVALGLHEITATMGSFLSSQPVRLDIAPEGDRRVAVGTILRSPLCSRLASPRWPGSSWPRSSCSGPHSQTWRPASSGPAGLFLGTLLLGLLAPRREGRVCRALGPEDRYLYIRPIAPAASTVPQSAAARSWRPRLEASEDLTWSPSSSSGACSGCTSIGPGSSARP